MTSILVFAHSSFHSFTHSITYNPSRNVWDAEINTMHGFWIIYPSLFDSGVFFHALVSSHSIQQALWERAAKILPSRTQNDCKVLNRYQQQNHDPRIVAHFSLRKFSFVLLSCFPSELFTNTLTLSGSRLRLHKLWIKTVHSPNSEFIEVLRETVGKKVGVRIIFFPQWMSFFSSVGWKVNWTKIGKVFPRKHKSKENLNRRKKKKQWKFPNHSHEKIRFICQVSVDWIEPMIRPAIKVKKSCGKWQGKLLHTNEKEFKKEK